MIRNLRIKLQLEIQLLKLPSLPFPLWISNHSLLEPHLGRFLLETYIDCFYKSYEKQTGKRPSQDSVILEIEDVIRFCMTDVLDGKGLPEAKTRLSFLRMLLVYQQPWTTWLKLTNRHYCRSPSSISVVAMRIKKVPMLSDVLFSVFFSSCTQNKKFTSHLQHPVVMKLSSFNFTMKRQKKHKIYLFKLTSYFTYNHFVKVNLS